MWIFIEVPPSEVNLAVKAGAVLHRKSGRYFFDDAKYAETDFSRWKRAASPESQELRGRQRGLIGLSLHEVANLTGHTNKIIRALIEAGRFPRPVDATGVSSRSDRWSLSQVQSWIDANGFGAVARNQVDEQSCVDKDDNPSRAAFLTMMEMARDAGVVPWQRAFHILKTVSVLIDSTDESLNNRPTDEYMRTGWFGRVERYLPDKDILIYQTVVTSAGYEAVLDMLKKGREGG